MLRSAILHSKFVAASGRTHFRAPLLSLPRSTRFDAARRPCIRSALNCRKMSSAASASAAAHAGDATALTTARDAAKQAERQQAEIVKDLKSAVSKDSAAIQEAVARLVKLKHELKLAQEALDAVAPAEKATSGFPAEQFSRLMTARFFYTSSYEIYGGVAGLYDLGPPGAAIKANIINVWRQHFVLSENMLELDCTTIAPYPVFEASGHVAKFCDLMCRDSVTRQYLRADHLLEEFMENKMEHEDCTDAQRKEYSAVLARADDYSQQELKEVFAKYQVVSGEGNPVTDPEPFNLMFATQIGPSGKEPGFFRPETAQGMFVNFKRLLEYNGGRLPFAAAQVGQAYRNEIAPRGGLLRTREFSMAEIEHFVHPQDKDHPKFRFVKDEVLTLFSRKEQLAGTEALEMPIGDAVGQKLVNNETLGYFMARTQQFLVSIGVKRELIRFRQHLANEMAHYACDCWDAEIKMFTKGWTECVGHADRSAFDLTAHARATNTALVAYVPFKDGPRDVELLEMKPDKGLIGRKYKGAAKPLLAHLESSMDDEAIVALEKSLASGSAKLTVEGTEFELSSDMIVFTRKQKRLVGENVVPGVIEPSFGIGRILTAVLEHSYYIREGDDEARHVLALPPIVAPTKCSVLPLMTKPELLEKVMPISNMLAAAGVSYKVDDSGAAIGRRYARTDEIGIPFAITIDYDTLQGDDLSVTLRERDSTHQVRMPATKAVEAVREMSEGRKVWSDVTAEFPAVENKD